ncbi:hypothetical protein [Haliangium sp. UPWRP_2]|uniref:phosphoribosyltransferase-like protein n=1 Tax=Haliangium sp. UPWRP_2 TaxID=1931276 RepID=UPI0011B20E45|nr:hypothetical protein [Haliangium sp. UPWRP_2]
MSKNNNFLKLESTNAWLAQFNTNEQPILVKMLQAMSLVSRDEFTERLRSLIIDRMAKGRGPVGLYAERELRTRNEIPNRLFRESSGKVKRAEGAGPRAVDPILPWEQDIGSEGIVAQLISEICRSHNSLAISHPGPNLIRQLGVRRFMLVTDFIGSGRRASEYLTAAWRVRSVRSWWSSRSNKGMSFEVVSYAATPSGRSVVESVPCKAGIHVVTACPTINLSFDYDTRCKLKKICVERDPVDHDPVESLGFKGSGALIAFAHGAPNNVPRLLVKRGRDYVPLFPQRITAQSRGQFTSKVEDAEQIQEALKKLRQTKIAASPLVAELGVHARQVILVMAALSCSPRDSETISLRTGLTVMEVERSIAVANSEDWIDGRRRLTDRGHAELANARKRTKVVEAVPIQTEDDYYPRSLRAPEETSS